MIEWAFWILVLSHTVLVFGVFYLERYIRRELMIMKFALMLNDSDRIWKQQNKMMDDYVKNQKNMPEELRKLYSKKPRGKDGNNDT